MGISSKLFGQSKSDNISNVRENQVNSPVFDVHDDLMAWPIEKANLTFHYFEACLKNPKPGQFYFSVKVQLEELPFIEHIWLNNPEIDEDGSIYGIIADHPVDLKNAKKGSKVVIPADKVSDWLILENGRLIGGYTIRAIRQQYQGQARREFDKTMGGIIIDDGEDYFKANFETPEGAILCLEEAYNDNDLNKAVACKDFYNQAKTMIQSIAGKALPLNDEAYIALGETLKMSFMQSMSISMPKFPSDKRAFTRNFISEDECIISELIIYPDRVTIDRLKTYRTNGEWKVGEIVKNK